jgi:hypothetical protein
VVRAGLVFDLWKVSGSVLLTVHDGCAWLGEDVGLTTPVVLRAEPSRAGVAGCAKSKSTGESRRPRLGSNPDEMAVGVNDHPPRSPRDAFEIRVGYGSVCEVAALPRIGGLPDRCLNASRMPETRVDRETVSEPAATEKLAMIVPR